MLTHRAAELAATPLPPYTTPMPVSAAEGRVLELCARGLTDREVADALGISYRSVRTYLESAGQRVGARGRTRLTVLWVLSHQRADLPRASTPLDRARRPDAG